MPKLIFETDLNNCYSTTTVAHIILAEQEAKGSEAIIVPYGFHSQGRGLPPSHGIHNFEDREVGEEGKKIVRPGFKHKLKDKSFFILNPSDQLTQNNFEDTLSQTMKQLLSVIPSQSIVFFIINFNGHFIPLFTRYTDNNNAEIIGFNSLDGWDGLIDTMRSALAGEFSEAGFSLEQNKILYVSQFDAKSSSDEKNNPAIDCGRYVAYIGAQLNPDELLGQQCYSISENLENHMKNRSTKGALFQQQQKAIQDYNKAHENFQTPVSISQVRTPIPQHPTQQLESSRPYTPYTPYTPSIFPSSFSNLASHNNNNNNTPLPVQKVIFTIEEEPTVTKHKKERARIQLERAPIQKEAATYSLKLKQKIEKNIKKIPNYKTRPIKDLTTIKLHLLLSDLSIFPLNPKKHCLSAGLREAVQTIILELIKEGADITWQNSQGQNAFHLLAQWGDQSNNSMLFLLGALLQPGYENALNKTDLQGNTPLDYAKRSKIFGEQSNSRVLSYSSTLDLETIQITQSSSDEKRDQNSIWRTMAYAKTSAELPPQSSLEQKSLQNSLFGRSGNNNNNSNNNPPSSGSLVRRPGKQGSE